MKLGGGGGSFVFGMLLGDTLKKRDVKTNALNLEQWVVIILNSATIKFLSTFITFWVQEVNSS